jgi:putative membrane protein
MIDQFPVLNFVVYLALGLVAWASSVLVYMRVTPMDEGRLIAAGNLAAAYTLSGAALGLALPIASLAIHAVNLLDMAIWAVISLALQVVFYVVAGRRAREVARMIAADNRAVGMVAGAMALSLGVISACCLSY